MPKLPSRLRRTLRAGLRAAPPSVRDTYLPRVEKRVARLRRRPRWGNLRSFEPVSIHWGGDRGLPVDRYYFDQFLRNQSSLIRGRVLEILDDTYSKTYGGTAVTSTLVIDIDGTNPHADLVTDLCAPNALRDEKVDSIVLTQTIGLLPDYPAALQNLWGALNPGGAMLITNNVVGRVARRSDGLDAIRHTPLGLKLTVERVLPDAEVIEFGFGNLITSTALLHGISADELHEDELDHYDETFPTSCAVVVRKPPRR